MDSSFRRPRQVRSKASPRRLRAPCASRPRLAEVPPKAKLRELGRERTRLETRLRLGCVVAARCDVVRRIGMEERCEHLDLPAADAELELPAAVEPDSFLLATLV